MKRISLVVLACAALGLHLSCTTSTAPSPLAESRTARPVAAVESPAPAGVAKALDVVSLADEDAPVEAGASAPKPPAGSIVGCKGGGYAKTSDGCKNGVQCRILSCLDIYKKDVAACDKNFTTKNDRRAGGPWAKCTKAARDFNTLKCQKLKACPK